MFEDDANGYSNKKTEFLKFKNITQDYKTGEYNIYDTETKSDVSLGKSIDCIVLSHSKAHYIHDSFKKKRFYTEEFINNFSIFRFSKMTKDSEGKWAREVLCSLEKKYNEKEKRYDFTDTDHDYSVFGTFFVFIIAKINGVAELCRLETSGEYEKQLGMGYFPYRDNLKKENDMLQMVVTTITSTPKTNSKGNVNFISTFKKLKASSEDNIDFYGQQYEKVKKHIAMQESIIAKYQSGVDSNDTDNDPVYEGDEVAKKKSHATAESSINPDDIPF